MQIQCRSFYQFTYASVYFVLAGVLISPQPDKEGKKLGSMSGTRAILTTSRRELSSSSPPPFLQGKAPKETQAILTEILACFLPGRAKDLSTPKKFKLESNQYLNIVNAKNRRPICRRFVTAEGRVRSRARLCMVYTGQSVTSAVSRDINPLNAESNPFSHLLALLRAHHIFHVSRIRVKPRSLDRRFRRTCCTYQYGYTHLQAETGSRPMSVNLYQASRRHVPVILCSYIHGSVHRESN